MAVPVQVARLIETFERNIESYRQGRYNEAQVRKEFIDPFFKALGWDVDNTKGWAEAYKDVIHEDAIRVGGATKAPDYCFRIGGTRKFFLEAKKPSVNIKDAPDPAYQLRRYAWSAKLPLSILTDFEEFAVYDCRVQPNKTDKPSKARILYYTYDQYSEQWDEIASVFSRDAVLKGSFDKYAVSEKRKRGTAEVDAAFLAEIERWRDMLARNIALRNPELTNRQLNYAVQITIDRIIFLRICEDRGIEPYGQLQGFVGGTEVYARLVALFRRADDRYNSGLFHFMREKDRTQGPDELTPELIVDDKPLKDILRSLYYPDSPYEFSVLPPEILGQVYEQFLGKVITLTAGHHAKVEDKPEVKKAGGVYYTPSYIVDYIVEHTVGKLLEDRGVEVTEISRGRGKKRLQTPVMNRPLRVLDPACGSGSFLLGAYQKLLDWYRDYYAKNDPQTWAKFEEPPIACAADGSWKLTTAERKRILLDHIYGVDIDPQAVEVTKLSLLLRVLEGEKNLVLFHNERALPDLADNIKCGNSLIGPDFYEGKQFTMFDDDERLRINAFDWHAEFPRVFQDGGFDAVIGNPPYGAALSEDMRCYMSHSFHCGSTDTAALFLEHGIYLLSQAGTLGYIIPKPFSYASNWARLREQTLDYITDTIDVSKVWQEVKLEQIIVICRKASSAALFTIWVRSGVTMLPLGTLPKSSLNEFGFLPNGVTDEDVRLARAIMARGVPLSQLATNQRGAMLQQYVSNRGDLLVVAGRCIQRWAVMPRDDMRVSAKDVTDEKAGLRGNSVLVQNIVAHIQQPIDHIKITAAVPSQVLAQQGVILDTVNQLICLPDVSAQYVCGLLNSRCINWFTYRFLFAKAIRTMHFDGPITCRLYLPAPNGPNCEVAKEVAHLNEEIGKLRAQSQTSIGSPDAVFLDRELRVLTDRQNRLVYALFRFSDSDVAHIEGTFLDIDSDL
ncbi:MAG: N-6 DNA methylase [Sedimentisphaerales bacterium]|jgi:predicted type IV restriction endonuclease|nr:N-6 DNA methylase [Sedimentisphaerales bacterium]HNY79401.1 N-6 DNA methylase [Sedimentisphaerales bacterium]HOC64590.1 N-6 DNA methylase [Sedimentisphaerales bacterium]HOH65341.1 N-6 DNA methylase [Sedimentisphaerales bacterium]HPY49678.1 N-6 DNA methylase [Sedimentisphaerales bacterium]